MGKRDKNYCSIEQILDASSMSLPLRAEMLARSEDRHEHVGPSGPNSFLLPWPRPDGRGYYMPALRAFEAESNRALS